MKVNVGFAVFIDVIEFIPFMGKEAKAYQEAFLEYYCKNWNEQMYMETETIIKWMNEIAPKCEAKILEKKIKPGEEDTSLPYMCF